MPLFNPKLAAVSAAQKWPYITIQSKLSFCSATKDGHMGPAIGIAILHCYKCEKDTHSFVS